jgi:hypothetical protein
LRERHIGNGKIEWFQGILTARNTKKILKNKNRRADDCPAVYVDSPWPVTYDKRFNPFCSKNSLSRADVFHAEYSIVPRYMPPLKKSAISNSDARNIIYPTN